MNDRVKIVCSNCRKPFSERAPRLKNGYQVQCPSCMRLITFDTSSGDPNIRRPPKAARDFRIAAETALVMARKAAQEPKRDSGNSRRHANQPVVREPVSCETSARRR